MAVSETLGVNDRVKTMVSALNQARHKREERCFRPENPNDSSTIGNNRAYRDVTPCTPRMHDTRIARAGGCGDRLIDRRSLVT